jgi:hypothetical protein
MFRKIVADFWKNHSKAINTLSGKNENLQAVKVDGKYNLAAGGSCITDMKYLWESNFTPIVLGSPNLVSFKSKRMSLLTWFISRQESSQSTYMPYSLHM